jgi:hypothetical protein
VLRSGREDQEVEGEAIVPDEHVLGGNVHAGDSRETDRHILLAPHHTPDRNRNIGRRQGCRRHLIE